MKEKSKTVKSSSVEIHFAEENNKLQKLSYRYALKVFGSKASVLYKDQKPDVYQFFLCDYDLFEDGCKNHSFVYPDKDDSGKMQLVKAVFLRINKPGFNTGILRTGSSTIA